MVNIENLSFSYTTHRPPVLVDLNLALEPGRIYGLLGPNGAGKSTLLHLICGALTPSAGHVLLNGENVRTRKPSILERIFLVPEEFAFPKVSLDKFIANTAPFYPGFDRATMNHCLEVFELEPQQKLTDLSMGQRKKVLLSFGFACRTDLLLLDEPTNGLDIPGKIAFRRLAAELMDDSRIMLISTHQVRDLDPLLDHLLLTNSQSLIASASIPLIQSRLRFLRNADASLLPEALASMPAPGGYDLMLPNLGDNDETQVNLELLFQFAMEQPQRLREILRPDANPFLI